MANQKLDILVVEDSEADFVLLGELLEKAVPEYDLRLTNLAKLADAFKAVHKQKFDVVMLDLNLLDIQGIASVAALRAEIPNTPIVVCSGMEDPRLAKEAVLCGAQSYVVKGQETTQLLRQIIHNALAK